MSDTLIYHLLLTPEEDALVGLLQQLASTLLGARAEGWSTPVLEPVGGTTVPVADASAVVDPETGRNATRALWVSTQGDAVLRMCEPDADSPGWMELAGFPDGGAARWVIDAPPFFVLRGLSETHADTVWAAMRTAQAEALRQWLRSRSGPRTRLTSRFGFKSLVSAIVPRDGDPVPTELPNVARPSFAPEQFAEWLFHGDVSSLGRKIPEAGVILAGIAWRDRPDERLLVRPFHRLGSQSIVPVMVMRRGHGFSGGEWVARRFASANELVERVAPALARHESVVLPPPKRARRRETEPSVVWLTRFGHLEHRGVQPFMEEGAVQRVPGCELSLRVLEVQTAFAAPGAASGLVELSADGLRDGCTLYLTGTRVGSEPYTVRLFATGPRERADDLVATVSQALAG